MAEGTMTPKGILGRARFLLSGWRRPRREVPDEQAHVLQVVGRLAGGVAHDLNNILLVAQGYAEMALVEEDAGPGVRSLLGEMREANERAAQFVRDLLVVGQRGPFTPRALDLSDVVRRLVPALGVACGPGLEVRLALQEGLPSIVGDEELIGRLLTALCDRARQAIANGGTTGMVTFATSAGEESVVLRVTDSGESLSDEARARLFEPYLPGRSGGKGLGLGMSVAYAVAARHGGALSAESAAGGGTVIVVRFPVRQASASSLPAEAPAAAPVPPRPAAPGEAAGGETILIAEDDDGLRALAAKILRREGYAVLAVRDGQEAVEVFERERNSVRLIVLDDVMPRMGGRAAFEKIRAMRPDLPIILCSGYTWRLNEPPEANAAFREVLQKPWQPRELLRRVREGLGTAR